MTGSVTMDPTEPYYKAKRSLLFFAGLLLLSIFAGFRIADGGDRISIFPFQLERPEFLSTILFVVVIFGLYQFSLQWAAQKAEVQINRFHRIDFISATSVSIGSLLCYLGALALEHISLSALRDGANLIAIGVTMIAAALAVLGYNLEGITKAVGRRIKEQAQSDEQDLLTNLTGKRWMLVFNPTRKKGGEKIISFEEDGSIGEGRNNNEASWRVNRGLLEIFNSDGRVFSRFTYNTKNGHFEHTNDDDTLSLRSQRIIPPAT